MLGNLNSICLYTCYTVRALFALRARSQGALGQGAFKLYTKASIPRAPSHSALTASGRCGEGALAKASDSDGALALTG